MSIERVSVEFQSTEDRILVRVFFGGESEVLLWLTRRMVRRLWPLLLKMEENRPEIQAHASAEARQALLGMEHERALQNVKFEGPATDPNRVRPLGDAPLLVSTVQARREADGRLVLNMVGERNRAITLTLNAPLLAGFMKLCRDAVTRCEWDLELKLPDPAGPLAGAEGPAPTYH